MGVGVYCFGFQSLIFLSIMLIPPFFSCFLFLYCWGWGTIGAIFFGACWLFELGSLIIVLLEMFGFFSHGIRAFWGFLLIVSIV